MFGGVEGWLGLVGLRVAWEVSRFSLWGFWGVPGKKQIERQSWEVLFKKSEDENGTKQKTAMWKRREISIFADNFQHFITHLIKNWWSVPHSTYPYMQARSRNSLYFRGVALVDSHGLCVALIDSQTRCTVQIGYNRYLQTKKRYARQSG